MNLVVLKGRLTKDPVINYSNSRVAYGKFSVAVDRRVKNGNVWENQADFINCFAFGKKAKLLQSYFKKGSEIALIGNIKTGSYKKADGTTVYTTEVYVEEIEFCGSKNSNSNGTTGEKLDDGFVSVPDDADEEGLPFN